MTSMFGGARWRMVGWSILVLSLVLLAISVILYVSLSRMLMSNVDTRLKSASEAAKMEFLESGGIGELQREGYQAGVLYVLLGSDGGLVSNPQQVDVRTLPPDVLTPQSSIFETVVMAGDAVRVYAQRTQDPSGETRVLVVGQTLAPEETAARELLVTLALGAAAGLVLSFVGAWFLAARALVPIQHAFERQQEFVADASHELRTPLTILHSAADLLAIEPAQGTAELVREIREEIGRMERLTRDLLTLARSDRGELHLALGRVELQSLARDLARRVRILANGRSIQLELSDAEGPVLIEGDPDRLQEVGLIVLDNALRQTPAGGRIRMTVSQRGGRGFLVVEDTGEGIPAEHLSRVFDRFHRVDASRGRRTGGAGLGLAIARTLVDAHGGNIDVARRAEGGTRVTIELPLLVTDNEPEPAISL